MERCGGAALLLTGGALRVQFFQEMEESTRLAQLHQPHLSSLSLFLSFLKVNLTQTKVDLWDQFPAADMLGVSCCSLLIRCDVQSLLLGNHSTVTDPAAAVMSSQFQPIMLRRLDFNVRARHLSASEQRRCHHNKPQN